MNANMLGEAGGSQPHENIQPYLTVIFCIALAGIFPAQN
jgi:microcystin-dependent protein